MTAPASRLEEADAFFLVLDRETLRDPRGSAHIRQALHKSQVAPFEQWQSHLPEFPIIVVGRVQPRSFSGGRTITGLPLAFCRDVKADCDFVRSFDEIARREPHNRVQASAYLVLLSDQSEASVVSAAISVKSLPTATPFRGQ